MRQLNKPKPKHEKVNMTATKTNKHGYTAEDLREAADFVHNLDAGDLVREYLAHRHDCACGTYCAMVLDMGNKDTVLVNEPSWSCSSEEYFGESGVMSRTTILSGTRDHWNPGPDDGFEWDEGDDYMHPKGDYSAWIHSDRAEDKAEDLFDGMSFEDAEKLVGKGVKVEDGKLFVDDSKVFLKSLGWESFSVSSRPVNGWNDEYMERDLTALLKKLASDLDSEAEELESE